MPTNRRRHYRVSLSDALSAHERALLTGGGRPGIPNPGMAASAIARPYSGYHRSIQAKAAALIQSIASNHGFADGNKRTATILLNLLLERSGFVLVFLPDDGEPNDALADMVLDVVNRRMSFEELVGWLGVRIRRRDRART